MSQIVTQKKLNLKFQYLNDKQILNELKNFAKIETKWSYLESKSTELTHQTNINSLIFSYDDDRIYPWIFIYKSCDEIYEINNIVSTKQNSREISTLEYNYIIDAFAEDYRSFLKNRGTGTKVYKSRGVIQLKLENIISAPKVRKLFKRYLSTYLFRISYHPNDIQRLDNFIIALFRYLKRKVNIGLLKMYLVKESGWKAEEAEWCCNRIEIGKSILLRNKDFY